MLNLCNKGGIGKPKNCARVANFTTPTKFRKTLEKICSTKFFAEISQAGKFHRIIVAVVLSCEILQPIFIGKKNILVGLL